MTTKTTCPTCERMVKGGRIDIEQLIEAARRDSQGRARACPECRTLGADGQPDDGSGIPWDKLMSLASSAETVTSNISDAASNVKDATANAQGLKGAFDKSLSGVEAKAAQEAKNLLWEAGAILLVVALVVVAAVSYSARRPKPKN